jgi:phage regulator Rha-like protein
MNTKLTLVATQEQSMSSLEIAELTGKQHKHLMEAIRKMEPAWEKVQGSKFRLLSRIYNLPNGGMKEVPCYELSKTECLYIATKFNDEARAKLVLRWRELEEERMRQQPQIRHLLVSDLDVMHEAEEIVGRTLVENNRNADGCITASEIAKAMGMEAGDLNSFLVDQKIQRWVRGQYRLTPQYEGRGLAQDRLFIYYSKNGKQKEQTYLVWTQKGAEMIDDIVYKKRQTRN